ncbi:MAG: beta-galactosidase [bacterium]
MRKGLTAKIVLTGIFCLAKGFLFDAPAQNIVPNPSFEKGTISVPPINFMPARPATEADPHEYKVYIPDGWKIVGSYARGYLPKEQGWGIAEDKAHSGKRSIFLSDAPAFPAWYSEDFTLEPNTAYLAEAFIENTGMRYHDFVRIVFSILDANDDCLGYEEIVSARVEDKNIRSSDYGVKGWRHKQVYIRPRKGQAKMRIIIRLISTGMVYIDDISVRALTTESAAELEPPYQQKTPVLEMVAEQPRIKATGFYRVEQVDGVWWLVDPEGRLTWSIGVQSIGNVLWENPVLTKFIEEKYGGDQSLYLEDQIPRLRQWNFTTSGSWSGPAFYRLNKRLMAKGEQPFPSFHFIGFTTVGDQEYSLRNRQGMVNDFGEHAMVDPFNLDWRARAEEKVRRITSIYQFVPWLVGYFVDNEINFKNLTAYLHSKACRKELARWLSERYQNNIGKLNQTWSTSDKKYAYRSFVEIGDNIPDQDPTSNCENELKAFVRYLIKSYIDFTVETIRKYDKDHLIISNRFALGTKTRALEEVDDFIDLFDRYDIVCTNLYARSGGSYTPDQMALLQYLYEKTECPLLIGEFSFHAKESDIPLDYWGVKIVDTMKERGEAYRCSMMSWAYLSYMVGAHFYKWCNGYGPVGRYRGRNSGIVNDQNQPYQPFIDMATQANYDVLHARRKPRGHVKDFEYLNTL